MAKEPPSNFYVYALFRETGVPFYIGKEKGRRWAHHDRYARKGRLGYKCAIIRDMQARGLEVIKVKLHEGLSEAIAHTYEIALIKAIGRYPLGPLTNLTDGGDGISGWVATPETRLKMATGQRGRKHSPESIEKTAAAKRGQIISAEMRARIAAKLRGRKPTPETLMKLS